MSDLPQQFIDGLTMARRALSTISTLSEDSRKVSEDQRHIVQGTLGEFVPLCLI